MRRIAAIKKPQFQRNSISKTMQDSQHTALENSVIVSTDTSTHLDPILWSQALWRKVPHMYDEPEVLYKLLTSTVAKNMDHVKVCSDKSPECPTCRWTVRERTEWIQAITHFFSVGELDLVFKFTDALTINDIDSGKSSASIFNNLLFIDIQLSKTRVSIVKLFFEKLHILSLLDSQIQLFVETVINCPTKTSIGHQWEVINIAYSMKSMPEYLAAWCIVQEDNEMFQKIVFAFKSIDFNKIVDIATLKFRNCTINMLLAVAEHSGNALIAIHKIHSSLSYKQLQRLSIICAIYKQKYCRQRKSNKKIKLQNKTPNLPAVHRLLWNGSI
jgi:hypothetical protein